MPKSVWLLALLPVACLAKPSYVLMKTGTAGTAKPADCDFLMATAMVDRPNEQIAILDVPAATGYRSQVWAQDAATFKETVRAQVCGIGGDAVVTEVSGDGRYVRGTVLRWKEADAAK